MSGLVSRHPMVAAVYFASVLLVTMFTTDPWLMVLSLVGAMAYAALIDTRHFVRGLWWHALFFVMVALTNPLFSHKGVTPLFFLNGNPVTKEAVLYGVYLGTMLLAVLYWFHCLTLVLTEDKWLYLFGRVSPKLSLLLSTALRFLPLLRAQAARIRETQTAMGLYAGESWVDKLKGTLRVYSSLITWALENAIDTGASMKARGYGLRGRTHYAPYRFRRADGCLLTVIAVADAAVVFALLNTGGAFAFYPAIVFPPLTTAYAVLCAASAVLCWLPAVLQVKEDLQWMYYRSTI